MPEFLHIVSFPVDGFGFPLQTLDVASGEDRVDRLGDGAFPQQLRPAGGGVAVEIEDVGLFPVNQRKMAHVFVAQAPELADIGTRGEFAAGGHHAVAAENSLRRAPFGSLEGLPAGVVVDIFIPHAGDQIFRLPLEGIPGAAVGVRRPSPVEQGIAEPGGGPLVSDVAGAVVGRLADRFTIDHIHREVLVGEEHPSGGNCCFSEERK